MVASLTAGKHLISVSERTNRILVTTVLLALGPHATEEIDVEKKIMTETWSRDGEMIDSVSPQNLGLDRASIAKPPAGLKVKKAEKEGKSPFSPSPSTLSHCERDNQRLSPATHLRASNIFTE